MQLLLLLLMLLSGSGAKMNEIKPLIEQFGGKDAAAAVKQAEELSSVLSAVQTFASAGKAGASQAFAPDGKPFPESAGGYPLAPVAAIADEKITYALSRYIAENG